MTGNVLPRESRAKRTNKVKTGCTTCRIRKVKCDEVKPHCHKCVTTGRICDGYRSPFRAFANRPAKNAHIATVIWNDDSKLLRDSSIEITSQDVELLNRYFSTKTMFGVNLGCDEEAKQILQASLVDPPVRHAVLSLRALREDLETSGDDPTSVKGPSPGHHYGLQQYSLALGGLASNLGSVSINALKSALLCCQIFISIEQVRKNYAAMAQHIVRGLRIMHEYQARPGFVNANKLVPGLLGQLPLLDVFIIKLFAAPCGFADHPANDAGSDTPGSTASSPSSQRSNQSSSFRTIVPDTRTELTKIAAMTLQLLDSVSQVISEEDTVESLAKRANLLEMLDSWLNALETAQSQAESTQLELISVSFLRLFHLILKIVLLGILDYSSSIDIKLRIEEDRLQVLAHKVSDRVRMYTTCKGNTST